MGLILFYTVSEIYVFVFLQFYSYHCVAHCYSCTASTYWKTANTGVDCLIFSFAQTEAKLRISPHPEGLSNVLHCNKKQRHSTKHSVQRSYSEPRQDRVSQEHHSTSTLCLINTWRNTCPDPDQYQSVTHPTPTRYSIWYVTASVGWLCCVLWQNLCFAMA